MLPNGTASTERMPLGDKYSDFSALNNTACWIAAVVAAGIMILGALIGIPLMKRRYNTDLAEAARIDAGGEEKAVAKESTGNMVVNPEFETSTFLPMAIWLLLKYCGELVWGYCGGYLAPGQVLR
jgi:hypothetical protein